MKQTAHEQGAFIAIMSIAEIKEHSIQRFITVTGAHIAKCT